MYYSHNTLPITTAWGSTSGGSGGGPIISFDNTIFVAAASNLIPDGSLQEPYHSIGEALMDAKGRVPSAVKPIAIKVFPGLYQENGLDFDTPYIHLIGVDAASVIIKHAGKILTVSAGNTSLVGLTFLASGGNHILEVDGTLMTNYVEFYDCSIRGGGDSSNFFLCRNSAPVKFYDGFLEAANAGDPILITDASANDIRVFRTQLLGDIEHNGGDFIFEGATGNSGLTCLGSSNISLSDTFLRNSIGHTVQLETTGDVAFYHSVLISPGFVTPDNLYSVVFSAAPTTCEWINCTFRHDLADPNYSIFSTVPVTFSGHRNDFECGYNDGNITDIGIDLKGTPVNADLVVIEDSEDSFRSKKVELSDLPGGSGGPVLVEASEIGVSPGNHSLTGLANKFQIELLEIETLSTDWSFTSYSKDDYVTDPLSLLKNRNGGCQCFFGISYQDLDGTEEFHYNLIDSTGGGALYNIKVNGYTLR